MRCALLARAGRDYRWHADAVDQGLARPLLYLGVLFMVSRTVGVCAVLLALVACGGGGSGGGAAVPAPVADWVSGVFSPAANYVARCAMPRAGIDPDTQQPYPDVQGNRTSENNWLRSWSNDLYLWYNEIVDRDPALYTTPAYFDLLKTNALTPSGNPKDHFHFAYPTDEWQQLSQSGVSAGYGAAWALLSSTPPRDVRVAYTEPNSPAVGPAANLTRGVAVLVADGVDVVNGASQADVDTLNAAFFPATVNEAHTFTVRDPGAAGTRVVTMVSDSITSDPVQQVSAIVTGTGNVGYMLFNDHLATAEAELMGAVNQLKALNIVDLVLDVRYNGGGYLVVASELAYMIAGPARTAGKTFERLNFNNKHPNVDPVTGAQLTPLPFQSTAVGLSAPAGGALPTLNLNRVFVLTGTGTCSASESIINSLRGIDVEVIQIGSTTCGKPYGFYPTDNCGTTYFTVQFKGTNAKGFGDYADGFSPANTVSNPGVPVTGCSVADDFTQPLGNEFEGRLATALAYRAGAACPQPTGIAPPGVAALRLPEPVDAVVPKPQWLQNRIMRR
jgi:hypothetical protein